MKNQFKTMVLLYLAQIFLVTFSAVVFVESIINQSFKKTFCLSNNAFSLSTTTAVMNVLIQLFSYRHRNNNSASGKSFWQSFESFFDNIVVAKKLSILHIMTIFVNVLFLIVLFLMLQHSDVVLNCSFRNIFVVLGTILACSILIYIVFLVRRHRC